MELFPEIEINAGQAEVIARGMFAVARAEGGIHEREAALVRSFYGDVAGGGAGRLASLEQAPDIEPAAVATALSTPELARLFLKSCLLLAWADGGYGAAERALVERYGAALGVGAPELGHLEQGVKEHLLGHFARLANVEGAVEIARKLGL